MKKTFFVLPLILSLMTSCEYFNKELVGSGNVVEEVRSIEGFSKIRMEGTGSLYIKQGSVPSLSIKAEDNIIPVVLTEVKEGTLHVGLKKNVWDVKHKKPIKYLLTVVKLEGIDLSGTGSIVGENDLVFDDLGVSISGAGDAHMHLKGKNLKVEITGAGDFDLSGEVVTQKVRISGTGDYSASRLTSREAEVAVSGSGDATVRVADLLRVEVSGLGTVSYIGSPKVEESVTGLGRVVQLE